MCVEDHHTIFKASEDLDKAFDKLLVAVKDLALHQGTSDELANGLREVERVAMFLRRKSKQLAETQP